MQIRRYILQQVSRFYYCAVEKAAVPDSTQEYGTAVLSEFRDYSWGLLTISRKASSERGFSSRVTCSSM